MSNKLNHKNNIGQVLINYLKDNKFTGLKNKRLGCACDILGLLLCTQSRFIGDCFPTKDPEAQPIKQAEEKRLISFEQLSDMASLDVLACRCYCPVMPHEGARCNDRECPVWNGLEKVSGEGCIRRGLDCN